MRGASIIHTLFMLFRFFCVDCLLLHCVIIYLYHYVVYVYCVVLPIYECIISLFMFPLCCLSTSVLCFCRVVARAPLTKVTILAIMLFIIIVHMLTILTIIIKWGQEG